MQKFKGDDLELKMIACVDPVLTDLSTQKDLMNAGAYSAGPLGDLLWTDNRTPLSVSIKQDIFRYSFQGLFEAFQSAGTFEGYMDIFRATFGPNVGVEFTVPAPGKLTIDIIAQGFSDDDLIDMDGNQIIDMDGNIIETHNRHDVDVDLAIARETSLGVATDYNLLTESGDFLGFQVLKGFKSQYELQQMLFEMVPYGIFTTITLTI